MGIGKNLLIGALAGLGAGVIMSAITLSAKKTGVFAPPIVEEAVEERLEARLGVAGRTTEKQKVMLSQGLHLLNTGTYGAFFGLLTPYQRMPVLAAGVVWGLIVFGMNMVIGLPALHLTRPISEMPGRISGRQFGMHVFYGTTTALLYDRFR